MIKIMPKILITATLVWTLPALAHDHHHMEQSQPISSDSLYNLTESWTTQDGKPLVLAELRGQLVVLSMLYTNCTEMCPLTVEQMHKIETQIEQQHLGPVHFVAVTFDSQRDTPDQLQAYAHQHGLDSKHWTLLNGTPDAVRQLAPMGNSPIPMPSPC